MNATDDFYFDLSGDPEEAYVTYHRRECDQLQAWQEQQLNSWWGERQFVDAMTAFDEVYALSAFSNFSTPPTGDSNFSEYFTEFKRTADKFALKIRLEHSRRAKSGTTTILALDTDTKQAVRRFIDAIREVLDASTIPEDKRRALFAKLNAFAAEVDQNLSRTAAFFEFTVQAARTFREAGAEFQPVAERIDRILDLFDKAQKWWESLPPWGSRKQINKPTKRIEGPKPDARETADDDIPF